MSFLLQYGTYTFPNTFTVAEVPNDWSTTATKNPHTHGANVATPWRKERRIDVVGTLLKNTGTPLQTQIDALRAALEIQPQNLYIRSDAFLRNAVVESAPAHYDPTWQDRIADMQIRFVSGDPYFYATLHNNPTNAIAANPASFTVTAGGTVKALPVLTIAFSSPGTLVGTITNSATGDTTILNGTAVPSSGTLIIDSLNQSVTIAGIDRTDVFDGVFMRLAPGGNTLTFNLTSGSISNVGVSWYDRIG